MRLGSTTFVLSLLSGLTLVACGDDESTGTGGGGTGGDGTSSSSSSSSSSSNAGGAGTGGDATGGGGGGLTELSCEVIVIGGGAGGVHTAFRLAPELGDGVCLFEKEAFLGGRFKDIAADGSFNDPDEDRVGVGGRRVMPQQDVLLDLATELELTLETPELGADLVNARGIWALSKEDLLPAYPTITPDVDGDTETALYEELLFGVSRDSVDDYDNFRAYVTDSVGNEEFAFLRDASRFRADFDYPLDAAGYMDYLTEEWDVYGTPSYPVGGMSSFVLGMASEATDDGARFFTGEPVARIERSGTDYVVETATFRATAARLVIAVPPVALDHIEGDVADDVKAAPEYQDIIGVKVVTITQWWDAKWWDEVTDSTTPIWRGWTTEHCLNFIEIPLEDYARAQNVTRSVYNDDLDCSEFWQTLWEQGGEAAVEAEVQRGLEHLFVDNGVSTEPTNGIPAPVKTHVEVWPAAWHWLVAGTPFTNEQVFDWSVEPLAGEEVSLVGEAYNVNRSGWSDGAFKSSIRVLEERFDVAP